MIRTLCYYLYLCKYQLNSVKFKSCVMFLEGRVFKMGGGGGGALKNIFQGRGSLFKGGAYSRKYGRQENPKKSYGSPCWFTQCCYLLPLAILERNKTPTKTDKLKKQILLHFTTFRHSLVFSGSREMLGMSRNFEVISGGGPNNESRLNWGFKLVQIDFYSFFHF